MKLGNLSLGYFIVISNIWKFDIVDLAQEN